MTTETVDIPNKPGVYLLTHTITGDTYVGSSGTLRTRMQGHRSTLGKAAGSKVIAKLLAEHGGSFVPSILEITDSKDRLRAEARWIEELKPTLNRQVHTAARLAKDAKDGRIGIAARVAPDLLAELQKRGDGDDRTLSWMVECAIRFYLENRPPGDRLW